MSVDTELIESLSQLWIFADLPPSELEQLTQHTDDVTLPEGVWVMRAGDENASFYIIVEGEAGVVIGDEEVALLSRGTFFGEVSALLDEPVSADIVTRAPLRCLVVPADELESFLIANPRVMFKMLQTEARRLRNAQQVRT